MGASVVVNYAKSKAQAESVVDDITQAGGKATAVAASVDKAEEIEQLFAETKRVYGILDILANNAGGYVFGLIEAFALDDISKMFRVNVIGLLLATKASLPLFFQLRDVRLSTLDGRLSAYGGSTNAGKKQQARIPSSFDHRRSNPTFSDGQQPEPSGHGFFNGEFNGIDLTIKDSKRFAKTNGWGFFTFGHHPLPYDETAAEAPATQCAGCHITFVSKDRYDVGPVLSYAP